MNNDSSHFSAGNEGLVFRKFNTDTYTKLAKNLKINAYHDNKINEIYYMKSINLTETKPFYLMFKRNSLKLPQLTINSPALPNYDGHKIDLEEVMHANDNPEITKVINGIRNRSSFLSYFKKWPAIKITDTKDENKFTI